MTTFARALAVLSTLAVATPALAHTAYDLPRHARDYEAVAPRMPQANAARPLSFGDDDAGQTATGGPVGGLIDKN